MYYIPAFTLPKCAVEIDILSILPVTCVTKTQHYLLTTVSGTPGGGMGKFLGGAPNVKEAYQSAILQFFHMLTCPVKEMQHTTNT
jgi:hypothetical protein